MRTDTIGRPVDSKSTRDAARAGDTGREVRAFQTCVTAGRDRHIPPTKLTDAAWQRGGVAPVTGTTGGPIQKRPTTSDGARANAGESPAIGQPFNISWGGRGDESTELS